jgi:hypothetical protein
MFQLESIKELERFIIKHKKDYRDLHRTTEQERDNIEHEVTSAWHVLGLFLLT